MKFSILIYLQFEFSFGMFFIAPDCACVDEGAVSLERILMIPIVICNLTNLFWGKRRPTSFLYLEGGHRYISQKIAQVDLCRAGRGELAIEVSAELAENLLAFGFFHIWKKVNALLLESIEYGHI